MDASELSELSFAQPSVDVTPRPSSDARASAKSSVEHFVAPLAALGFASALLISAANGVNDGKAPKFRPALAIALVVVGALLGWILSRRPVQRCGRWLSGLVVIVIGVAVGEALGVSFGQGYVRAAAVGLLQAVIFLPSIWVVAHAAGTVGRARAGSLIDRSDRRAVWAATAASVAVGYGGVELWPLFTLRRAPEDVGYVCFAMALLASLALTAMAAMDVAALRRVRRATRAASATAETEDAGLGDEAYELRNTPACATNAMKWAVARSLCLAVLAWAGIAAPLVIPRIPHREAFVRVTRESFTAQAIAPSGVGAIASTAPPAALPGASVEPTVPPSTHFTKKIQKKNASHKKKASKKKPGE
jgi:uncharacterized membrane protein